GISLVKVASLHNKAGVRRPSEEVRLSASERLLGRRFSRTMLEARPQCKWSHHEFRPQDIQNAERLADGENYASPPGVTTANLHYVANSLLLVKFRCAAKSPQSNASTQSGTLMPRSG